MRVVFENTTKKGFICVTNPVDALNPEAVLAGKRMFAFACSLCGGGSPHDGFDGSVLEHIQ